MPKCKLLLFSVWLLLSLNTSGVYAAHNQQQPDDNNLLIVGVKVDFLTLDEVIPAYRLDSEYYLPLSILSQVLGIAVKVDLGTETADGFVISENRQFHLDVSRHMVTLNGISSEFPADQVYVYPDDIYVNSTLLEKWWPMKFELNLFTSQVLIKPEENLPFQKKLLRDKEIEKLRNRYKRADNKYPEVESQYGLISPPFVDQRISANYQKGETGKYQETYNYTTHIKADMLYHETSLYIAGSSEEDDTDTFFTASRSNPQGGMLGFMNARHYSFVHISTPGLEFVSSNKSGIPGVKVSNYPLKRQTHFDKHSFEGELLPDWEVELYHNNALIAYKDKATDGKYQFQDIPLLFGHNYFKLVFYGPHGEIREETHTFSLTGDLVIPGSYYYELAMAKEDSSELQRTILKQDIGISKYLSAQLNFASIPVKNHSTLPVREIRHDYASLALNGFLGPLFYKYNYVKELDEGNVQEVSMQARMGRTNLTASLAVFDNFTSEQYQATDPLEKRTKYRIDTIIPPWWLPTIPISLEVVKDEHESGNERIQYTNRISASARGLAVSNTLTRIESNIAPTAENGVLQVSTHSHSFALRSELYYANKPVNRVNAIALNFSGKFLHPYQFNFGVTKFSDDEYQYSVGLNKQFGNYSLLTSANYKTTDEWGLNMAFAISFGRDPRLNRWHTQATPLAVNGSASLLVYFDKNQNGVRDEGEEGLPNIGFRFNDSLKQKRTDKEGVILFTDLPTHQPMDLSIDLSTLEDPLMVPSKPGVRITARPGSISQINFPVILTGEIDGFVYLKKNSKNIPVGEIEMELLDESKNVIQKIKTAYDGFYVMSRIPAGKYLMRVSPEYANKSGLKESLPREIIINAENPFVGGANFVLFLDDKKDDDISDLP